MSITLRVQTFIDPTHRLTTGVPRPFPTSYQSMSRLQDEGKSINK